MIHFIFILYHAISTIVYLKISKEFFLKIMIYHSFHFEIAVFNWIVGMTFFFNWHLLEVSIAVIYQPYKFASPTGVHDTEHWTVLWMDIEIHILVPSHTHTQGIIHLLRYQINSYKKAYDESERDNEHSNSPEKCLKSKEFSHMHLWQRK